MARFVKGVSGNPGGRAKELVRQVREKYADDVPKIVEVLRDLALGKTPEGYGYSEIKTSDRIKAGAEVLDRVLGKAHQEIEATVTDVTESQRRMLEALAMTPHQRRKALDSTGDADSDSEAPEDATDEPVDVALDE